MARLRDKTATSENKSFNFKKLQNITKAQQPAFISVGQVTGKCVTISHYCAVSRDTVRRYSSEVNFSQPQNDVTLINVASKHPVSN